VQKQLNSQSLISVTPRAPNGHQVSGVQVSVQPSPRDIMHGIYPKPVSRLRGGLFCFKEVMYMWILVGYILCAKAGVRANIGIVIS